MKKKKQTYEFNAGSGKLEGNGESLGESDQNWGGGEGEEKPRNTGGSTGATRVHCACGEKGERGNGVGRASLIYPAMKTTKMRRR